MDLDQDKVDEAALALLLLTLHDMNRAWKNIRLGCLATLA
jgi:hypothetical protein